ncbi:hypothetical protein ABTW95_30110 [Spirillospora sp. NPDC127506]
MSTMEQFMQLLGLNAERSGLASPQAIEQRSGLPHCGVAELLRGLPGTYRDRLPHRALRRITGFLAQGRWETAVEELVTALQAFHAPVSPAERENLRTLLHALGMPAHRVDALPARDSSDRP